MTARRCISDPEATLTLTGRGGAAFLTANGELRGFVPFDEVAGFDVFPVDVDGDGVCEFVDRAGGWQPVGLIDAEGRYVFRYGRNATTRRLERLVEIEHSPTDIVPFDVGADGRLELLVPLLVLGRDETHVLSAGGRRLRVLPENLEGSRALGGKLFTPRGGKLVVRDAELQTTGEIPMGRDASWSFVRWPGGLDAWHLAVVAGGELRVLDPERGTERARIDVEPSGDIAFLGPYVVSVHARNRQLLRIFEEVLELGGGLAALTDDSFLLSECAGNRCPTVGRYRLP